MASSLRFSQVLVALGMSWLIASCSSPRQGVHLAPNIIERSATRETPPEAAAHASSIEWPLRAEPQPGLASLQGIIEVADTVLLGELYLATTVATSKPGVEVLELDAERAPRAQIDRSTGQFVFQGVAPGMYGIIIWEPMASAPLADPQSGETLFVELKADQIVDVGVLRFP